MNDKFENERNFFLIIVEVNEMGCQERNEKETSVPISSCMYFFCSSTITHNKQFNF